MTPTVPSFAKTNKGSFNTISFKIEIPLVFTFQDKRLHTTTPKRQYFRFYASPVIFFYYLVKYEKMLIVVR